MPLTPTLGRTLDAGWAGYQASRLASADSAFREVLSHCPRESYPPGAPGAAGALLRCAAPLVWSWPTWEVPFWHAEVKPLFRAMQEVSCGRSAAPTAPRPRLPRP